MNICLFSGYVQKKPEVKLTSSNTQVTKFDIAVPRNYKSKEGKRDYDYFALEAWGQTADLLGKYYDKGSWLNVQTEARVDKWVDQNGNKRYSTVYRVNEVFFGGQRTEGGAQSAAPMTAVPMTGTEMSGYGAPAGSPSVGFEPLSDDGDLPF